MQRYPLPDKGDWVDRNHGRVALVTGTNGTLEVGMEILCHCKGRMERTSHEILENRVEQTYVCGKCGEKILVVKDRSWEETMGG